MEAQKLQYFNFSKMEATIYVTLLKHGELNGSQISKILGSSRSAVYDSLRSLKEKGAVILFSGETNVYRAKSPDLLMDELKNRSIENAEDLKKELQKISVVKDEEEFWNFKGRNNFILKARELISTAEEEIYLNTNFPIAIIEPELEKKAKEGIRIIMFSFQRDDNPPEYIELYNNMMKGHPAGGIRLMLVIDRKKTLVASKYGESQINGTYTENPLMVSIILEHIHHDIYIMRLEQKYGKNLIDDSIRISSKFEGKMDKMIEQ